MKILHNKIISVGNRGENVKIHMTKISSSPWIQRTAAGQFKIRLRP